MGLFNRKNKKEETKKNYSTAPELPELPRLPELPPMHHEITHEDNPLPQLPTFPNNPLGNKFSQNTIKDAVAGKKEEREVFAEEDFLEQHGGMMQKPLQKSFSQEYENYRDSVMKPVRKSFTQNYDENGMIIQGSFSQEDNEEEQEEKIKEKPIPLKEPIKTKEIHSEYTSKNYMNKKAEPIFIRIDKFEEGMKIFQEIKTQISDIEKLIKDTKNLKNKEEQELISWEREIQKIKNEIEKVDVEIFSRVE